MRYRSASALEMAIKQAAKDSPLDTGRAIEGFYRHRLLCRVFSDPTSSFVLKGGQSVLARTTDARNSRDVDLSSNAKEMEKAIDELLRLAALDLDDYVSFELDKIEEIKIEDEYKAGSRLAFDVFLGAKKRYRLRIDLVIDWVPEELIETIMPVDRIEVEGVATFGYRTVPVSYAVADKYFGVVDLHNGRVSSRVKDLVDIILYASHCPIDEVQLRQKLEVEARMRHKVLPDEFRVPSSWYADYGDFYKKVARDAHVLEICPTLGAAESKCKDLYDPVLRSLCVGHVWNPERWCWE